MKRGLINQLTWYVIVLTITTTVFTTKPPVSSKTPLTAKEIFLKARKLVSLKITHKDSQPNKQEALGTAWFTEHVSTPHNLHGASLAAALRLVAIYPKEVFFKGFEESWLDVNPLESKNRHMSSILALPGETEISSYQMEPNSPKLTLALSNGTIFVLDLSKKVENGFFKQTFRFADYTGSWPFDKEFTRRIRSIGHIPYTELLLVYPCHCKHLKFSRIDGTILAKDRPAIDTVRHIILPEATTWPLRDPYNPALMNKSARNPEISNRVYDTITQTQAFLVTSDNSEAFAVIDWTTMKTYNHLTLRSYYQEKKREKDYIVQSACYYGGIPESHTYLMVPSYSSTNLLLFSGIYRNYIGKLNGLYEAEKTILKWAYGSEYVVVWQKNVALGDGGTRELYKTSILNLGTFSQMKSIFKLSHQNNKIYEKDLQNFALMAFPLTPQEKFKNLKSGIFGNLDHLYLTTTLKDNLLTIRPPVFNWEHCKDHLTWQENSYMMLYGAFKVCTSDPFSAFETTDPKARDPTGATFINVKRYQCDNPELEVPLSFYSKELKILVTYCYPKHVSPSINPETMNDNHCPPGLNKDRFGVCRACSGFRLKAQGPSYVSSDCFLFILPPKEPTTIHLGLSYYILNYTKDWYNEKIFRKDHSYKGVYLHKELFTQGVGNVQTVVVNFTKVANQSLIRNQKTSDLKHCYELQYSSETITGYKVRPAEGYHLELIEKDRTGQASKQLNLFDLRGDFNEVYCKKDCKMGMYYDFDSISCRVCQTGCAECFKYDQCSTCLKNFYEAKVPVHSIHAPGVGEKRSWRSCFRSCKRGFYKDVLKQECMECSDKCLECVDHSEMIEFEPEKVESEKKEKLEKNNEEAEKKSETGFCTQCLAEDPQGNRLYISRSTGKCVTECKKKKGTYIKTGTILTKRGKKFTGTFCLTCSQPFCLECSLQDPSRCLKCSDPEELRDGKCERDRGKHSLTVLLILGIMSSIILAACLSTCVKLTFIKSDIFGCGNNEDDEDLKAGVKYAVGAQRRNLGVAKDQSGFMDFREGVDTARLPIIDEKRIVSGRVKDEARRAEIGVTGDREEDSEDGGSSGSRGSSSGSRSGDSDGKSANHESSVCFFEQFFPFS